MASVSNGMVPSKNKSLCIANISTKTTPLWSPHLPLPIESNYISCTIITKFAYLAMVSILITDKYSNSANDADWQCHT